MNSRPSVPYISQFFILIGLVVFFLLFGGILLLVLASSILHVGLNDVPAALLKPENVNISRWLQFITTLISFLLPALIFAVIVSRKPLRYIGFNTKLNVKQAVYVLLILIAALILSNSLSQLSQHFPFPGSLKKFAEELEKQYMDQVKALAMMKNLQDYFISLAIIAILPAIFEEVLFRGCLQNILTGWFRSAFWGILVTSILFSAIHLSIYGFLTRMALSIILGYVFYYSRNLWLNIFFHFLNNGLAITMAYIYVRKGKPIEDSIDTMMPVWYGVIATLGLIFLFRGFKFESRKIDPVDTNEYLKTDVHPFAQQPGVV